MIQAEGWGNNIPLLLIIDCRNIEDRQTERLAFFNIWCESWNDPNVGFLAIHFTPFKHKALTDIIRLGFPRFKNKSKKNIYIETASTDWHITYIYVDMEQQQQMMVVVARSSSIYINKQE